MPSNSVHPGRHISCITLFDLVPKYKYAINLYLGDLLSSSLINAPTLLSSSVSKSSSVAIPRRPAADDSLLLSYGATAPHPRIRRPSDERYDERKFNPYRAVVGSAGSPCALAATGRNTNTVGLVKPININPVNFVFDPSSRQVKTGRALINPFDPSVRNTHFVY